MLKKTINSTTYFVSAMLFFIGSFLFIFRTGFTVNMLLYLLCLGILLDAILQCIQVLTKKQKLNMLVRAFLDIGFALFIYWHPTFFQGSLSIILGIYLLVHAMIEAINYTLYKKNHIRGRLLVLIAFLVKFTLSLFLMLHPTAKYPYVMLIIGIYFGLYGISQLNSFISEMIPDHLKNKVRISLPILIAAFIPRKLITLINEILEKEPDETTIEAKKKNSKKADIEVIIHLANSGSAAFGHIEISFEGKTYSYGNYDMHSRKLFDAIGDGVICIADRDAYIQYALQNKKRYLVVFGISLTQKEKEIVKNRIHKLITINVEDYYPDLQLAEMGKLPKGEYHDMSSEIYKLANGQFKKVTNGKWKKFFVLKTNCTGLVENILNGVGLHILEFNGLLTPGSYYDYLNREFLKKKGKVIYRKIYTNPTSK